MKNLFTILSLILSLSVQQKTKPASLTFERLPFSRSPVKIYFSTSGNDNTGGDETQANPYQTLAKLNSIWAASAISGDSFLLNHTLPTVLYLNSMKNMVQEAGLKTKHPLYF